MKLSDLRILIREKVKKKLNIMTELQKGVWVVPTDEELKKYQKEIFDLINKSYKDIGGHPNITSPSDINKSKIKDWEIIDVDSDPEPDAVSGAKIKSAGKKFVVGASDGTYSAKKSYLLYRINHLKMKGFYIEVSHKIADILMSHNIPVVDNKEDVEKTLGKKVQWIGKINGKQGNGWYKRNIGGSEKTKILLGNPNI